MNNKPRTFAFDFNGVIAKYEGFVSETHTNKPNQQVVDATKKLKEKGHKIIIHSTRSNELLERYCIKYDIPFDYINKNPELEGGNPGKPIAYVYIDDRAVRYKGQSADELVTELEEFKAY